MKAVFYLKKKKVFDPFTVQSLDKIVEIMSLLGVQYYLYNILHAHEPTSITNIVLYCIFVWRDD